MHYRHELKFIMTPANALLLKRILYQLMDIDSNGDGFGKYMVRSLYFDTLGGSAFFDKLDGVEYRKKYRIRYYNNDTEFIRLESKLKIDDLSVKTQERISLDLAQHLMKGEIDAINLKANSVLTDFALDIKLHALRPSVIVDYQRTAYLHRALDVRITFDELIRSRVYDTDLFKMEYASVTVLEPEEVVLEIKYNDIIPSSIADVIKHTPMTRLAVSKYAYCYNKK
jgi:hypothetical protein